MHKVRKKRGQYLTPSYRKAQVESQLNWVFILIVGIIILIFFTTLVFKMRATSDTKLQIDVLNDLDSIVTGAKISTGTSHTIQVPTDSITFECDYTGYSEFSLTGTGVHVDTSYIPLFTLGELKGKELITKAVDWAVPFRVTNFLLMTTKLQSFVFIIPVDGSGELIPGFMDDFALQREFEETLPFDTMKISFAYLNMQDHRLYKDRNLSAEYRNIVDDKVRFILLLNADISTLAVMEPSFINPKAILLNPDMSDNAVSLVTVYALQKGRKEDFDGVGKVYYYRKVGGTFDFSKPSANTAYPDPVYYLGKASLLGAIFSRDATYYSCNMLKAYNHLETIADVYQKRSAELSLQRTECVAYLSDAELLSMVDIIRERNTKISQQLENTRGIIYPYAGEQDNEYEGLGTLGAERLKGYYERMAHISNQNAQARVQSCPVIY